MFAAIHCDEFCIIIISASTTTDPLELNYRDSSLGKTALIWAAEAGAQEAVKAILEANTKENPLDINAQVHSDNFEKVL